MNAIWGMVLVLFLTVASGITATPVAAEEYACRGTVGARTLDNVRVPSGATCVLDGTTVKGTVTVGANATLKARGARVVGNIQAENHKLVVVNGGTAVGGSIQIDQGGAYKVTGAKVTGSIQASSSSGQPSGEGGTQTSWPRCAKARRTMRGSGSAPVALSEATTKS